MHFLRLAGPRLVAPAALALLLLSAGCASDDERPHPPRDAARNRHFTPIAGEETFFKGVIKAEVVVGAMTGFDAGNPGAGPGGGNGGGKRHHGGGMHGGGGPGGPGGGMGGPPPGGPGAEGGDTESGGNSMLRRADATGSAPVMIHLRFTNTGTEKVDLVIADFLSPLGNFVVQPERLTLEPAQSLEVEPMTSRLADEVSGGEITLSLKLGKETETKTVTLAPKPEAATPPPPPPAGS